MDHIPVLLTESIDALNIENGLYIDATFGSGNFSKAILSRSKNSVVFAIDRDDCVKKYADQVKEQYQDRFIFECAKFSEIDQALSLHNIKKIDGIVYDFGISSMQLDIFDKGFSFQRDEYLDMRMGLGSKTAFNIVNKYPQEELANLIYQYGGERKSRRIANLICEKRKQKAIKTTFELAEIITKATEFYNDKIHPATRTFQAIRIEVNDELQEISKSLETICELLKPNARVSTITFHSLEDEIVKTFFKKQILGEKKHFNRNDIRVFDGDNSESHNPSFKAITKKPITPSQDEVRQNPRSRSAKLRVYEKLS